VAEALTIARPYAEAVFRLAKKSQTLPAWSALLQLSADIARDEGVHALIGDPKVPAQRMGELFLSICKERLAGSNALTDEGRNFILLLVENGRLGLLPYIGELYEHLKAAEEGVLEASITSAFALNDAQLKDLVVGLEQKFKRKIDARVVVDAELIGGVIVAVGDEVLDASVRGKLEAMAIALQN